MPAHAHKPTAALRRKVKHYASRGVPHHDIGYLVDVSIKTLLKYYQAELNVGKAMATAAVAGKLYTACMKGNFKAQRFWLMSQAGWSERPEPEEEDDESRLPIRKLIIEVV